MADLDILNLEEMTELVVATARNLLPEDDYSKGSDNYVRARIVAAIATDCNAQVQATYGDLMADEAEDVFLDRLGTAKGVAKLGAVAASGEDVGLVRGAEAATFTTSDILAHPNGQTYVPASNGTIPASGELLVGIVAVNGGTAGNLQADEVLAWETTPTDLEDEVEIQGEIEGGLDIEAEGNYRNRVLNRTALPSLGGNDNDYEQWALESSANIAAAYVYPNRNGYGSVDIAATKYGSGSARLLNSDERTALYDYIEEIMPIGATLRVLETTTEGEDVEVTVLPESSSQYAKDWNDSVPPEVLSWTAGTRTLVFTADRPDSMAVGHTIVVDGTSGLELEIESLNSTDGIVLVDAFGETPVAASLVYSGGPLVTSVRMAILELFDVLGPRKNEFGVGLFSSTLYLSHLFETVQTTEGVLDSTIVGPVADAEPTQISYPVDTSQINILLPGNVLVRYGA